ncbi:MAG: hypothetical protein PHO46_10900 [Thermoguttaceae bacterium]|jgi:hypothetical protein|nr:hypothetical protein [Thermoguttaceae bacterium]
MGRFLAILSFFFAFLSGCGAFAQDKALEDAFFTLMAEFQSPLLKDRDAAEEELTRRFVEFEPVWQDRRFLTNGEVSPEARRRFEVAEARRRAAVAAEARASFSAQWRVDVGERTRGAVKIARGVPMRIVYLTPEFSSFLWKDAVDGGLWAPVAAQSSPEILPDFEDAAIEIETPLKRVDSEQGGSVDKSSGVVSLLAGLDLREITIPVSTDAEIATSCSGDLTLHGARAERLEHGGWTISFRLDYASAFDAFDSHRVWFGKEDFALVCENNEEKIVPTRLRTHSRSVCGVDVELDFAQDVELDVALIAAQARLACRLPRYFAFLRTCIQ